ncbi:IS1 family transposase, partial [Escherichia coli]|uniref:IS1 family transposase n=1 Tax=Escherichia coli TaxID=562 RepID=UPI00201A2BAC
MASVSISCPSCSATEGVVRNGKSTAGHQRYLCSHCRKTWQLQFTYTASQPGTHQKIIDMAMNGVGCRALMNPLMILVKIIKLRWIHILSYDQMVSRKINNQTTRCANSI